MLADLNQYLLFKSRSLHLYSVATKLLRLSAWQAPTKAMSWHLLCEYFKHIISSPAFWTLDLQHLTCLALKTSVKETCRSCTVCAPIIPSLFQSPCFRMTCVYMWFQDERFQHLEGRQKLCWPAFCLLCSSIFFFICSDRKATGATRSCYLSRFFFRVCLVHKLETDCETQFRSE